MPMRDPHVVALLYKAKPPKGFIYHEPSAVEVETETFKIGLVDWQLRIEPKDHFASPEDIRPGADRFVRSWSIASSLERGFPEIEFEYESAEVVDRIPPPPGVIEGHAVISLGLGSSMTATATVVSSRYAYPGPPLRFTANPDVETLWNRYQGYLKGYEPLPSMAYFCYTALPFIAGGFKEASARFGISQPVLSRLRELSSTRGDHSQARKFGQSLAPMLATEQGWLDEVVRQIIRRVGQVAAGLKPEELRMSDLRPIPTPKRVKRQGPR